MEELEEMKNGMNEVKELLGLQESLRIKAHDLYRAKVINSAVYTNLMLSLRDIRYTITSFSLSQELEYIRRGGQFYESIAKQGMFTKRARA